MNVSALPPGYRFLPTEIELSQYYLRRKVMGRPFHSEAISVIDLYRYAPWDLPGQSRRKGKDLLWYFFCIGEKKYSNGSRKNRATGVGYWKTSGKDKPIKFNSRTVAFRKTLVFHVGKAQVTRTDWVMHEYRLADTELADAGIDQDAFVLCKIYQKSGRGPKIGEQYGAPFMENDWEDEEIYDFPLPDPLVEETYIGSQEPYESNNLVNISEVSDQITPNGPLIPGTQVPDPLDNYFPVQNPLEVHGTQEPDGLLYGFEPFSQIPLDGSPSQIELDVASLCGYGNLFTSASFGGDYIEISDLWSPGDPPLDF